MSFGDSLSEKMDIFPIGSHFADRHNPYYVVEILLDDGASITYRAAKGEDDMLEMSKTDFVDQFAPV